MAAQIPASCTAFSLPTAQQRHTAMRMMDIVVTIFLFTLDRVHLQEQITLSVMPGAHHPHPPPRDDLWTQMTSSSPWLQREGRGGEEEGGDEWITHPIHPPSL